MLGRTADDHQRDETNLRLWRTKPLAYRLRVARRIAETEAARDKSDPFVYARVASLLASNVMAPEDFRSAPAEADRRAA